MPEISRFLGIVIAMYYKEHAPPHSPAKYGGPNSGLLDSRPEIDRGRAPASDNLACARVGVPTHRRTDGELAESGTQRGLAENRTACLGGAVCITCKRLRMPAATN